MYNNPFTLSSSDLLKFDIAIVGGGPAGLSAAYSASKKGAKVVLFEKDP